MDLPAPSSIYAAVVGTRVVAARRLPNIEDLQLDAELADPGAPWSVVALVAPPPDLAAALLTASPRSTPAEGRRLFQAAQPHFSTVLAEARLSRVALKKWKLDRKRKRVPTGQAWFKDAEGFLRPTQLAAGDGAAEVPLPLDLKIQTLDAADLVARALSHLQEDLLREAREAGFDAVRVGDRLLCVEE